MCVAFFISLYVFKNTAYCTSHTGEACGSLLPYYILYCVLVKCDSAVAYGSLLDWVLVTGMGTVGLQTATRSY